MQVFDKEYASYILPYMLQMKIYLGMHKRVLGWWAR